MASRKIAITGNRPWLPGTFTDGSPVDWTCIPVLDFQPLPVRRPELEPAVEDVWCLFSSPRGVEFWLEQGWERDMTAVRHYGAVGPQTAQRLEDLGLAPELTGDGTGAESFLKQFEALESGRDWPIILVGARGGRTVLSEGLKERTVFDCQVYASSPRAELPEGAWESVVGADAVVFTSPSSVEALLSHGTWNGVAVAIGEFTAKALRERGITPKVLSSPNLQEVGKLLEETK